MAIEHILNSSDETIDRFRVFNNEITKNFDTYSNTFLSLSVSNFLYKGKNKPKEEPGSYRKITIGTTNQKITDTQMTEGTGIIAKSAQPGTQYGFTENTNYLLCSVLRESLQTYAEDTKKPMICLTSDVSDAFSRTDRISQLYELSNAGEFGKFLEYSINTYKRTILVIKGDKEFTEIIEDKIGAKQGAKKSAPDFKLYNIPLDNLIKNSKLGYK